MKQKKYSIIGLLKEYSEKATIHGISYVFSASNAVEKFIWWAIIIYDIILNSFYIYIRYAILPLH